MPKLNPAPWNYENVSDCRERTAHGVVKDANGRILFDTINADVAEIMTEHDEGTTYYDLQAEKNLTLAAAAPDLLRELADFHDHTIDQGWHQCDGIPGGCPVAAAIAKAKGEPWPPT